MRIVRIGLPAVLAALVMLFGVVGVSSAAPVPPESSVTAGDEGPLAGDTDSTNAVDGTPVAVSKPVVSNAYCSGGYAYFTVRPSAGNSQTTVTIYKLANGVRYTQGTYTIHNYINFRYWAGFPYTVHMESYTMGYTHWFIGC